MGWAAGVEQLESRLVPSAVVLTDKSDYAPGSTAVITGSGFQVSESVHLEVLRSDGTMVRDYLYVVDGSFFPSSGAVNPALTIMANALRVGDRILERLSARRSQAASGQTAGVSS